MRTTLNLADDVLETARLLATRQQRPLGDVISSLIRSAVEPPLAPPTERNGIPLFPVARGARAVTPETVAKLLDETP
ncbi:MAG: CopG family transcriptional regulator [Verrucomicrobia bacterium]|nr:MAG: CopG family transcriptional regulator [Verrucomicrobiota bacterium]